MGRPYTPKEMKAIVDYLVEHRAYGEVRGRKMWMDMESAKVIDRTWQSLKETFIKRILPDIHNPYYKLSVQEISSFRSGNDVAHKSNSKLEIRTGSDASNTSDNGGPKEQVSGEAKCSKIQNQKRNSSTETLVLENCDDNDPQKNVDCAPADKTTKSLRDLITYSEPLTPMLQEVIDDFSSDDEPPLQIVEDIPPTPPEEPAEKPNSPDTIRESQSYYKTTETTTAETDKSHASKIKSLKLKKTQKGTWENKEPVKSSKEKEKNSNESEMTVTSEKNSTVDTQLPNNQEGLAFSSQPARMSTESSASEFVDTWKKKKEKRKRSHSQGSNEPKKKKKDKLEHVNEIPNQTDTITFNSHPNAANTSKELANRLETSKNETIEQSNKSDDTNIPPNVVVDKTNEGTSQEAGPSGINNIENPCLIPASLYADRFSQSRYSDFDDEEPIKKSTGNKNDNTATLGDVNQEISKDNHESNINKEANGKNKDSSITSEDVSLENSTDNREKEPVGNNKALNDLNKEKGKNNHERNENEGMSKETSKSSEDTNQENSKDQQESDNGESVARNIEITKATNSRTNNDPKPSKKKTEDVVLLKSHSESDSDDPVRPKKVPATIGKSRERALANVFGFSSGSMPKRNIKIGRVSSNRHRKRRTKLSSTRTSRIASDSGSTDEYVTENESSDDNSHDRLNNSQNSSLDELSRKYQKPPSFDIAEDAEGTHVFVVGRKKVYPVLIRNKDSLRYAKLRKTDYRECFEDDSRESFWKEKFLEEQKKALEEKIRADELARLLREANERAKPIDSGPNSPILQPYMSFNTPSATPRKAKRPRDPSPIMPLETDGKPADTDDIPINKDGRSADRDGRLADSNGRLADSNGRLAERDGRPTNRDERPAEMDSRPQDRVRIKFTKDKEIEFEGQWNHVTPVLEKMVAMFHSADAHRENNKNTEKLPITETNKSSNAISDKRESSANAEEQSTSKSTNGAEPKSYKKDVISNAVTEKQTPIKNSKEKEITKGKPKAVQRKTSAVGSRKSSTEVITSEKQNEAELISSGVSTPGVPQAGPEANPSLSRLYQIENEVFKKIEAIDKAEQTLEQNGLDTIPDENITKRKRGRPKKVSSSLSTTSTESLTKKPRSRTESRGDVSPAKTVAGLAKRTRIRSVSIGAIVQTSPIKRLSKKFRTRSASLSNKSPLKEKSLENLAQKFKSRGDQTDDDIVLPRGVKNKSRGKLVNRLSMPNNMENIDGARARRPPSRYSESSGASKLSSRARSKVSRNNRTQETELSDDDNVRYMLRPTTPKGRKKLANRSTQQLIIPPHESSRLSESTQGYQESNPSPIKIAVKKKRKLSIALSNKRAQSSSAKRTPSPYLADDSCSNNEVPIQKYTSNSTLNSEVYKSESYQLLVPKTKQITQMDKIDESPNQNVTKNSNRNFTPISVQVDNDFYVPSNENRNEMIRSPEINSSNVSPLQSPELSVVENLTVSRDIISSSIEHPCLNETQMNEVATATDCDKYMISEVDVSMPLMQQNCELQTDKPHENLESITEGKPTNSVDDSLDKRLRDLLLESAKKITEANLKQQSLENMEVDNLMTKETKTKRRSSTPRKKTSVRKTATPKIDPVLEEHTENCSNSGRRSCPPIINVIPCLDDDIPLIDNNNERKSMEPKGKKKKDVLKVKIIRPRRKSSTDKHPKRNRLSDSGINETQSVTSECKCCDDSIELIHNHSDTCLNDDCIGDSVIFIENPSNSIISLTSSLPTASMTEEIKSISEEFVTPESFCTNAQDATKFNDVRKPASAQSSNGDAATVYFTPPDNRSFDSLITDDLSDEPPPSQKSNWYLLSEDDTNSKFVDAQSQNSTPIHNGSNSNPSHYGLKQIFPLTYAVPDLSTISERSKENESKQVIATDSDIDAFSSLSVEF